MSVFYENHYKCSVCGGEVEVLTHPTYPPQTHYKCLKCGRHHDERPELKERDVVITFKDTK